MIVRSRYRETLLSVAVGLVLLAGSIAFGQAPPVLNTVFPAGGQIGQSGYIPRRSASRAHIEISATTIEDDPIEAPLIFISLLL